MLPPSTAQSQHGPQPSLGRRNGAAAERSNCAAAPGFSQPVDDALDLALDVLAGALQFLGVAFVADGRIVAVLLRIAHGLVDVALQPVGEFAHVDTPGYLTCVKPAGGGSGSAFRPEGPGSSSPGGCLPGGGGPSSGSADQVKA